MQAVCFQSKIHTFPSGVTAFVFVHLFVIYIHTPEADDYIHYDTPGRVDMNS